MKAANGASANQLCTDVVVIGGGLSGLASAIHLACGGMRVVLLACRIVATSL
jgi:succinate dehydrogenase/fumarate reductase flavoprotein subunit